MKIRHNFCLISVQKCYITMASQISFSSLIKYSPILGVTVFVIIGYSYFSSGSGNSPNFIPITSSTTSPNNRTFLPPVNPTTPRLPLILTYNSFFGQSFFTPRIKHELKNCKYECRYSENKE